MSNLKEKYYRDDNGNRVVITSSVSEVANIIKSANNGLRILYDDNIKQYMIGDSESIIHMDIMSIAIQHYYYPPRLNVNEWNKWSYMDEALDDDKLFFLIYTPKGKENEVYGYKVEKSQDDYDTRYNYDFGYISSRQCDFTQCDLYYALGKPESITTLNDFNEPITTPIKETLVDNIKRAIKEDYKKKDAYADVSYDRHQKLWCVCLMDKNTGEVLGDYQYAFTKKEAMEIKKDIDNDKDHYSNYDLEESFDRERSLLYISPSYSANPKSNTTRFYHQTMKSNINSIIENGLLTNKAKWYDNPGEVIWLTDYINDNWNYGDALIEIDLPNDFEDIRKVNNGEYNVYSNIPKEYINAIYLRSPYRKEIMRDFNKTLDIDKSIERFRNGELDEDLDDNETNKLEQINNLIDDLYKLRQDSIEKDGEFGIGNLVFKEFRNMGYLDNLKDLKVQLQSKEMSLENLKGDNLKNE